MMKNVHVFRFVLPTSIYEFLIFYFENCSELITQAHKKTKTKKDLEK